MKRYNPSEIEPKLQKKWLESGIYNADDNSDKPKKYILDFFPYPSGSAMHVGHVRNYTISDVMSRFARMNGYNVLHPMGWDAFGLPAENYAIKTGISPQQAVKENTGKFKQQFMQMGIGMDWSREFSSTDPEYYKWTQWFFKLLFDRGLAYQKESLQWWCDTDKTVLANEQVEAGKCWRCGNVVSKKPLKQWFFKITDYADRLVEDLEDLNWSDAIKSMQRNWIGKSQGAEVDFKIDGSKETIKIFTTRPDTLFGATFMVLAPEHPIVHQIAGQEKMGEIEKYIAASQAKSDIERQETDREKTGVFTGAYAINPVNGDKLPIYIADYVLYGYGTGAIMAVPAHDERDFAFATKFDIPIKPVISPIFNEYIAEGRERPSVSVVIRDPKTDKYCVLAWHAHNFGVEWPGGGIDEGESVEDAALREAKEETGYVDLKITKVLPSIISQYLHRKPFNKGRAIRSIVLVDLVSDQNDGLDSQEDYEKDSYEVKWLSKEEVLEVMEGPWRGIAEFAFGLPIHVGEGSMINSGKYNNMLTEHVREQIVADLEKEGVGKGVVNYRIRDWLISRQRYWGAPIPIVHCPKDGAVTVPEDQLPVELPEMQSYEPSGDGRSPLARVEEWVNTTCPKCGGKAVRETDTMDGFACSSWYFLRFADPKNTKKPFSKELVEKWLPVDEYIGGAEHAVMHLLYARMWTKVMQDAGLIDFAEPFTSLRNHGMILAPDGRKMSKSWGNVIAPDELIANGYGADSIRVMEMFIAPWNQAANWSTEGLGGCYRFLQRVWTISQEFLESKSAKDEENVALTRATHKVIKQVTEDIQDMSFNTAIAAMMEFTNFLYKQKAEQGFKDHDTWRHALTSLFALLAPFAPHMTEELWDQFGVKGQLHSDSWPNWDDKYLVEDEVNVVVQVNGKVRANVKVATGATKDSVESVACADDNVKRFILDKNLKKVIYVPDRLINFVVE